MKTIHRDRYLNQIIDRKENGLIKIITGIRRCGKSYLLFNLYYDYLLQNGVKNDHIIKIALDDDDNKELRDPDKLSAFLHSKLSDHSDQKSVKKAVDALLRRGHSYSQIRSVLQGMDMDREDFLEE